MKEIMEYDYPKQFILNEEEGTKISRNVGEDEDSIEVDDYQFSIITTITEKNKNGVKYSRIQHEDQRLGWINLNDSIQLFRFKPKSYMLIEDDFKANEINDKLNIVKDFKTHFSNKILTVKSEIEYEGKRLLSIFIKDRFFGFHDAEYFEEMISTKIKIDVKDIQEKVLYKISKMETPYTEKIEFDKPRLVSIFRDNKVGRIRANREEYYWLSLHGLEEYFEDIEVSTKSNTDKYLDDIFYGIEKEREQSREAVKTVLSAQGFLNSKKIREKDKRIEMLQNSFNKANERIKELESGKNIRTSNAKISDEELLELKRSNHKLSQALKLSDQRLEQQRDYNRRLEEQRDKYKNRMQLVEEKLKKLTK